MAIPIACDGDSLTVGQGETSYPTQLAVLYPGATYAVVSFGNSGQTLEDMQSDAATQIDATYDPLHTRGVLVCWGGVNDFNNGATKEQVFANLTTYVGARLAAGGGSSPSGLMLIGVGR